MVIERRFLVLVCALVFSAGLGIANARADAEAVTCSAGTERLEFAAVGKQPKFEPLVLCWGGKDDAIEVSVNPFLGIEITGHWMGSRLVSGREFFGPKNHWPEDGSSVDIYVSTPERHVIIFDDSLASNVTSINSALKTIGDQASFGVSLEESPASQSLTFERSGDDIFAASRRVPPGRTPKGVLEYRVRTSGGQVDYMMRCLVEDEPADWARIGCRIGWLSDRYTVQAIALGQDIGAIMESFEALRGQIDLNLVAPAANQPPK
ncbi:MAG TPA: hypothetical protein VGQ35_21445 [Dongiaceae bacterium]|jgi:hypothetical protein|nr:hypothetical protein [Dongiaceae bacterium]